MGFDFAECAVWLVLIHRGLRPLSQLAEVTFVCTCLAALQLFVVGAVSTDFFCASLRTLPLCSVIDLISCHGESAAKPSRTCALARLNFLLLDRTADRPAGGL